MVKKMENYLRLDFYVPASHLEEVKDALFDAGAGKLGKYENCCWETLGRGQFRPLSGSVPFLGRENELECVKEYKVEMIFQSCLKEKIVSALKQSHPYEEPAYQIIEVLMS